MFVLRATFTRGGETCTFCCWVVDGQLQTKGQTALELTVLSDVTVIAQYDWRLDGDTTGDCSVNILDLIYVRNRLGDKCSR